MDAVAMALSEFVRLRMGDGVIPVTVISVDLENYVFDAQDGVGNDYQDVRMNATPGKSGLIVVPEVGSSAFIQDLGNQGKQWAMIAAGTVAGMLLIAARTPEQSAVLGEELNRNLSSLLNSLTALTNALSVFAQSNGVAAAGALAPLAPAYTALNAALPQLLTDVGSVQGNLSAHLSQTVKLT